MPRDEITHRLHTWLTSLTALCVSAALFACTSHEAAESEAVAMTEPAPTGSLFLARIQPHRTEMPLAPTAEEQATVRAHFQQLQALNQQGVVLMAGLTASEDADPDAVGLVVIRAESLADARAIMENDAAVRAGVMNLIAVQPFRVALGEINAAAQDGG